MKMMCDVEVTEQLVDAIPEAEVYVKPPKVYTKREQRYIIFFGLLFSFLKCLGIVIAICFFGALLSYLSYAIPLLLHAP